MNTALNESAIIELMRQEHAKAEAKAEELWQKLKQCEAAMKPYKDVYDKALCEWSDAQRLEESLKTLFGVANDLGRI